MAPDLNSLPPSSPVAVPLRAMTNGSVAAVASPGAAAESASAVRGESPSPSPRSASISLQAAATVNAGLQHEPGRRTSRSSLSRQRHSPQAGRRRSAVLMNLQLNDPSLPAPGEMVLESGGNPHHPRMSPQPLSSSPLLTGRDPHHNRAPSLGELHQELEAEQEAQVNRLLHMIRQQQLQLQQLQAAQTQSSVAAEDHPSTSDRSTSMSHPPGVPPSLPTPSGSIPRSPSISHPPTSSPRLRSTSISQEGEPHLSGVRDETAYYQAETQSLIRENQMLRHRLRELERQLSEVHANANAAITREPAQPSHLTHSTSVSEGDAAEPSPMATSQHIASSEAKDE
ncbi:hypothetical protein EV127DRAFT_188221 [Xylaria flabelliformis]|nr:hypothetical protein EV127DRAFT_188221 [Xylaria flabelliformis]